MTFNSSGHLHAVLFTKEMCPPCIRTKGFIDDLLEKQPHLANELSVMKKENHSALVESYQLNLYPTLIVVGANGHEFQRVIGGEAIRRTIETVLEDVYAENYL